MPGRCLSEGGYVAFILDGLLLQVSLTVIFCMAVPEFISADL
jgi:hypothetical protein